MSPKRGDASGPIQPGRVRGVRGVELSGERHDMHNIGSGENRIWRWIGATTLVASSSGCTAYVGDESGSDAVARVEQAIQNLESTHGAETAVTTINNGWMVITDNEDDPGFITYNNNSRQVRPNTSMMGFFQLSPDFDPDEAVGVSGRVRPPAGWSVLWGDPAITRNRANPSRIYMVNLAVPTSKFPASGTIEGPVNPSGLPAEFCSAYLGGACIARSSNLGASFTLAASDCVQRITPSCPNGTFYDGSDLETDTSGRVYAAFTDVSRNSTDVYLATSQTGSFARVTDPPGGGSTVMHPRLKFGPSGLYMLQLTSSFNLTISRYPAGSSRSGTWTTPVQVASSITASDVVLSDRSLRLGPEYDLDIGPNEFGSQEIRVVYTVIVNGNHHVRAAKCTTGTTISCSQPSVWRTDTHGGKQWLPAIVAGTTAAGAPFWEISYHSTQNFPGTNKVELWRGLLTNSNTFGTVRQETFQIPCPDNRGYWGDYDGMSSGTDISGVQGFTYRGMSQSFAGNCSRAQYTASPMWAGITLWSK